MSAEGCTTLRRGLLDHFRFLGLDGVAVYTWLILMMEPQTRTVTTSVREMCFALGTGKTQVQRALEYLEKHRYIRWDRGCGKVRSVITVLKPDCPLIGNECPMTANGSPCLAAADMVLLTADIIRAEVSPSSDPVVVDIFDTWNAAGIVAHKKITPRFAKAIVRALKRQEDNGYEDAAASVKDAIINYGKVLHSDSCWFKYRWTLEDFLGRGKGKNLDRFASASKPLEVYRGERKPTNTKYDLD